MGEVCYIHNDIIADFLHDVKEEFHEKMCVLRALQFRDAE